MQHPKETPKNFLPKFFQTKKHTKTREKKKKRVKRTILLFDDIIM